MAQIALLSQSTIDQIAAGEVVERPSSVVKELVENAIDAGASAITVEIKNGGTTFIRITDNGSGIESSQVPLAFLRHSTSKIRSIEDLIGVGSLGFRGEALSSIAAVSRMEMITKVPSGLLGTDYIMEGSEEVSLEETGAPDGTTILVKDLFFNTPARRKFLKTPATEGNYIAELVERLALSHPQISFQFIRDGRTKLHSSGNGSRRDLIYHIYGREITDSLLPVSYECELFGVEGFIGKPMLTRGSRSLENYFINDRYIKSKTITAAIEEAYRKYTMPHQFPFCALYFRLDGELIDVNVHPSKLELRLERGPEIFDLLSRELSRVLAGSDLIPEVSLDDPRRFAAVEPEPQPFDGRRLNDIRSRVAKDSPYQKQYPQRQAAAAPAAPVPQKRVFASNEPERAPDPAKRLGLYVSEDTKSYHGTSEGQREIRQIRHRYTNQLSDESGSTPLRPEQSERIEEIRRQLSQAKGEAEEKESAPPQSAAPQPAQNASLPDYEEISLASLDPQFLSEKARSDHRIIGQLFDTYWLIEYQDKLYIIDQHAAHEKVLFERMMARLKEKDFTSQSIHPPILLSLEAREVEMLEKYLPQIRRLGYEIEHFGGKEYRIHAVPDNLYRIDMKDLFVEMLDEFAELSGRDTPELILEKVASMSCKAAVKGNNRLSRAEADALIAELLTLDNPYNCPHGRPTIISMSRYELEKKFKRIV